MINLLQNKLESLDWTAPAFKCDQKNKNKNKKKKKKKERKKGTHGKYSAVWKYTVVYVIALLVLIYTFLGF